MTDSFIELSEDAFDALFPLIRNHLDPNATWSFDDGGGCLFEVRGAEFDFIRSRDPRCVWTLIDGDDGLHYLVSGCHFVNRVGYLVSTVPLPEGVEAQVRLDQPEPVGGDHESL